jgi:hypothetical protein
MNTTAATGFRTALDRLVGADKRKDNAEDEGHDTAAAGF